MSPPGNAEGASEEAPPDPHAHHGSTASVSDPAEIPKQVYIDGLRRRRVAAVRMPPLDDGHADPWHDEPVLPLPSNLEARRKAWQHLNDHGLVDDDGWVTSLLSDAGGVTC